MEKVLSTINAVVWGIPVLALILIVGIYLSLRSGFAQLKLLPQALRQFCRCLKVVDRKKDGISGYKALCTALAATVGTGNIAGVAGAIAIGGPGVIFWMWVCALLGMITKLAEVSLAIHYRIKDNSGSYLGGPMYMIERGLPKKFRFLSFFYCFFGVVAAFGVGNATQINAVVESAKDAAFLLHYDFGKMESLILGLLIAVLITIAFRKGSGRIGAWAEKLVPFASIFYIILAMGVLLLRRSQIPEAISVIVTSAFSPRAVTGGVVSSAFLTLRVGASRGVFTNEAGMGTASIAHAAADVSNPIDQGLLGIMEVFLDTILICTMTAMVILCSGVQIPYGTDPGIKLTMEAFSAVYGNWCKPIISVLVCIFAFATVLGWGLYGARCAQYLFGETIWSVYVFSQALGIVLGSILDTSIIWLFSEIVNGLMSIPNLIALVFLSPVFFSLVREYHVKKKAYSSN